MNELKSYTEYTVSTPTADFVIGFDFNYGEDAVNVTVDNVPATEAGYTVVYLNETTIQLSPSVPSGVVRLQRETDIDQTDHAYRAGAKFIAQTMDENFEQLRHSQQEVRDGFSKLSDDTYEIIEGLDTALELAQDAAQNAQDAAVIAQDAADTVNTIIIGGKVGATNVLDASGKTQQEINSYTARKLDENYSITDFIIIGENYTDANFDWSPVYERAIQHILSKGGGRLNTPHKATPYLLGGILRTDGQIVGIEIPFTGGSDFGSTAKKVDFICESQSVRFAPMQNDMIVFRHASSYCEIGKFQIHHNDKLRCTGFALTPQNWTNPASASQQSHNHIHDIYTYGMLEGFIYQSGGSGGCYYNTAVNCYAVGTTAQGGRGLVLKAGIKSTGQATRASPPNRNRFYNFKTFSTNVAIDIQSGDTNYFYGLSSENNLRAGAFAATPTALRVANVDSEGHGVQGNIIYGLSIEGASKDAEILSDRIRIYGHTLTATKTTLSPTFVSSGHGTIKGAIDLTIFPEIDSGVIHLGGDLPAGLPAYEFGKTDTSSLGIHDYSGRFKAYALTLDKFENVAAVSNSVSYASKYNKRVDFECRFNFRPLAANSAIQVALPFEANFNLYASLTTHEQSFAFPVYIQFGATSNRQIAFARVVSLNGTTATHLEVQAPAAGWNIAADGQYNVIHIQLNYRSK